MRSERHWSIYLPALAIAVLWAGILFWADRRDPPLESIRLLALFVEGIGVPLLYVWAFFRGRGAELSVSPQNLYVSTGGFRPQKVGADLTLVDDMKVAQSFLQKLVGAGRIEVRLASGRRLLLEAMARPAEVAAAFRRAKRDIERDKSE